MLYKRVGLKVERLSSLTKFSFYVENIKYYSKYEYKCVYCTFLVKIHRKRDKIPSIRETNLVPMRIDLLANRNFNSNLKICVCKYSSI